MSKLQTIIEMEPKLNLQKLFEATYHKSELQEIFEAPKTYTLQNIFGYNQK